MNTAVRTTIADLVSALRKAAATVSLGAAERVKDARGAARPDGDRQ